MRALTLAAAVFLAAAALAAATPVKRRYETLGQVRADKVNVHIIPHTHDDGESRLWLTRRSRATLDRGGGRGGKLRSLAIAQWAVHWQCKPPAIDSARAAEPGRVAACAVRCRLCN